MTAQLVSRIVRSVRPGRRILVRLSVAIAGALLLAVGLPGGAFASGLNILTHVKESPAPAYDAPAYTYDGALHSVQVHAGEVAPASCSGASKGAQETVATVTGPFSVASRLSVAANTGLSGDLAALSEANIANSGKTVIGAWEASPTYIEVAQARGASYFDIGDTWNGLSATDRWAANSHFLDTRIAAADTFYSTVPSTEIRIGSDLAREVAYLQDNGYQWVNQWALKPSG